MAFFGAVAIATQHSALGEMFLMELVSQLPAPGGFYTSAPTCRISGFRF